MQLQFIEILILYYSHGIEHRLYMPMIFYRYHINIDYDITCKRKVFTKDIALLDISEKKPPHFLCETAFFNSNKLY
jgi:hypothetical protein